MYCDMKHSRVLCSVLGAGNCDLSVGAHAWPGQLQVSCPRRRPRDAPTFPPPAEARRPAGLCFPAVHLRARDRVDQKAGDSGLLLPWGILGRCPVALTLHPSKTKGATASTALSSPLNRIPAVSLPGGHGHTLAPHTLNGAAVTLIRSQGGDCPTSGLSRGLVSSQADSVFVPVCPALSPS